MTFDYLSRPNIGYQKEDQNKNFMGRQKKL